MRTFRDLVHRLHHLVHGFVDLAGFVHLPLHRIGVGSRSVLDPGRLLPHVGSGPADRTDQLRDAVGHIVEFHRQRAQLITVAELDVGGHVPTRHAARGLGEVVDRRPYGHEETDVEVDHHDQHRHQGNDDPAPLLHLLVEP